MQLDICTALNAERAARGRAAIVVTDIEYGKQRLVKAADVAGDPLRGVLDGHLRTGKSGMEETPQGRVFLTVYVPAPRSSSSARYISARRWRRSRSCSATTSPSSIRAPRSPRRSASPTSRSSPNGRTRRCRRSASTATPPFVALTHDPKIDDPALAPALARDCFYIGALGSRKTHARRARAAQGARRRPTPTLARIHAPIGLDIGAVSPAEIAVSIMARDHRAAARGAERPRRAARAEVAS